MCHRGPPVPQRFPSTAGQRSSQNQYPTDQPPADIADSILTNPWTAALVQGDSDRPQLYCNSTALTRVGLGSWAPEAAAQPQGSQGSPEDQHRSAAGKTAGQGNTEDTASQGTTEDIASQGTTEDTASQSSAESGSGEVHDYQKPAERDGCRSEGTPAKLPVPGEYSPGAASRKPADHDKHSPSSAREQQSSHSCSSMQANGCQGRDGSRPRGHAKRAPPHPGHGARQGIEAVEQHQASPSTTASGAQHAGLQTSSSDRVSSHADAHGGSAAQAQHTSNADWAAAFTSRCGKQSDGAGQFTAAPSCNAGADTGTCSAKHRGFASWIGDFGHLEGPRFSKQQGKTWQAHMRSQKDQPADSPCNTGSLPQVRKTFLVAGMTVVYFL